jgi:hypothetical protein
VLFLSNSTEEINYKNNLKKVFIKYAENGVVLEESDIKYI